MTPGKTEPPEATGEAKKHDADKPRMDLIPPRSLLAVGAVMGHGARVYGQHNWRLGMHWGRLAAAAMRHTLQWVGGQDIDPDSGLPHLAHAAASMLMLLESCMVGHGTDDRHRTQGG